MNPSPRLGIMSSLQRRRKEGARERGSEGARERETETETESE